MENEFETIILTDENGEEASFEVIARFDIEEKKYILLTPEDEDDEIAIPMRVLKDEDGELELEPVENETEIDMIEEAYEALMEEE